jgi:hypothetical protein
VGLGSLQQREMGILPKQRVAEIGFVVGFKTLQLQLINKQEHATVEVIARYIYTFIRFLQVFVFCFVLLSTVRVGQTSLKSFFFVFTRIPPD